MYVHRVRCTSCGFVFAGYLDNLGDGTGEVSCPKCEAKVVQALPPHYVEQVPISGREAPAHHSHASHHPGLYAQPKRQPRLDLKDLLRVGYRPAKAFESLYLSTDLQRGLSLVLVFSLLSAVAGVVFTAGMGEIFGYDSEDAMLLGFRGFASWMATLFAFLVFAVVASMVAKSVYGGRGERGSTIALVGYCFPAYVLVNIALIAILSFGFNGLELDEALSWGSPDQAQASWAAAALVAVALVGLIWLVWIVSWAIGVSNDISRSEGVLTAIIAAIAAGLVYVVAGAAIRLPVGLSP